MRHAAITALLMGFLVLLVQQIRTERKDTPAQQGCNLPCTTVKGVQVTSIPDSEGGGDHVYLQLEDGLIGPFLKLPSLPRGVGYGSTETEVPSAPTAPCKRGQWAQDEHFLYMCVSLDINEGGAGSVWKRLPFDRSWTPDGVSPRRRAR